MKEPDDHDAPRSRPRKKSKKRRAEEAPDRRLPLLIGGGVGATLLIGLVIWGVVRLFSDGGSFGAVVAEARPAAAECELGPLPPDKAPGDAVGWKATPDGAPLATGLASAVVLPEGRVQSLLFADPSQAQAAVLIAAGSDAGRGVSMDWVRVDLKSGRVAGRVPLGNVNLGTAALSPSGGRLAVFRHGAPGKLQVLDASGKTLLELSPEQVPIPEWLAFATEDRLVTLGGNKLAAWEVAGGKQAFVAAREAKGPVALSPGRRWVAAATPKGELNVFSTADGSVAGHWPASPNLAKTGGYGSLAFHPDGKEFSAMYGAGLVTWDAATGKTLRAVKRQIGGTLGHPANFILCLGPRYMLFWNYLYDVERDLGLWRYKGPEVVSHTASPDGRIWAAGSYKELVGGPEHASSHTPGPVLDAVRKGTPVLGAFTVPHADPIERLAAAEAGISIIPGRPIRVEVVGRGGAANKRLVAEGAAEALAKRGIGVDPAAKVGLRIELSSSFQKKVVFVAPGTPPGLGPSGPGTLQTFVPTSAKLFNRETGALAKSSGTNDYRSSMGEPGWEEKLYKHIGTKVGESQVPVSGMYDVDGADVGLNQESGLGIDGVLGSLGAAHPLRKR